MKKSLIAGAGVAALAVAAVPFAGVFAAVSPVTVTDNLALTVNEACTFSEGGTGLNLTDTIDAGKTTTWSNSNHEFIIKCNSNNYAVTAIATDLTKTNATGLHGTISYVDNGAYNTTATAATADDGVWSAFLTGGDTTPSTAVISKAGGTIKSGTATTTDTFSVAYKAYAGQAQEQGTYTGTVIYTLTGSSS